jgi:hypothetical protein
LRSLQRFSGPVGGIDKPRCASFVLNGAIEALSNLELSETAVALGRIRKDLEDEGNYESAAVADLIRDRVADEQKMRAAQN